MKKNSFKKLSFVLALAMIFSVIAPAAGAFAATKAPKLNSTLKYLHLGVEGSEEYDFNIANKKSGWKYAWTTSNKEIANVNSKNGLVMATGIGTAKISVEITDKDGELVDELTATVKVRDNIKTVAITNTPANNKLLVGTPNDFNRSFETVSGATDKTSSVTRWTLDKTTGATISESGLFVATLAGEYTITAVTFQSVEKYNLWKADSEANAKYLLASATYKVTVAASMTAKQVDKDTFTVTFTAPTNNIDKNSLVVSKVVGGYKVSIKDLVKEIKVDADKKVATVDMYSDLTPSTAYAVDFANIESSQFTAATTKLEDVTDMQIATETVVINKNDQKIALKFFNKDNVDITTSQMRDMVTFTSSNEKTYLTADGTLSIFTKDEVTTITAVYHTYKYNQATGKEEGTITKSAVIRGVESAATTMGTVSKWSLAATGAPDYNNANQMIAAEDPATKVYVKVATSDATKFIESQITENASKFSFTSTDETILIAQGNTLYPVKAGTVSVLVNYTENNVTKVIDAITINVLPKRVPTSLNLDSYTLYMSNDADINDTKSVKIEVKDQYSANVSNSQVSISLNYNPSVNNADLVVGGASNVSTVANTVSFNSKEMPAGTYTYAVKANGITKYLTVNVQAPTDPSVSTSYKLSLVNANLDMKLANNDKSEVAQIKIYGYAANNVANAIKSVSGSNFKVDVIAPDGTPVATKLNSTDSNIVEVTLATTVANNEVVKLQKGTYKVRLTDKVTNQFFDQTTFEVGDSQATPVLTTNKLVSSSLVVDTAIDECFDVKINGVSFDSKVQKVADETGSVIGDITSGKTIFVKYLIVKETFDDGSFIRHNVPVNVNIKLGVN